MKTSGTFDDECARLGAEFGTKMNDGRRVSLVIATVSAIDEDAKTLEAVVDNDRIFSDISLNIFPNGGNSLYIIPSMNSLVVLGFIEGSGAHKIHEDRQDGRIERRGHRRGGGKHYFFR